MSESLLPERPVQFSPSLAAVIGVEEAILLQHIQICAELSPSDLKELTPTLKNKNYRWTKTSVAKIAQQLPFWQPSAIRRLLNNLQDLGMVALSENPNSADAVFYCAVTQHTSQHTSQQTSRQVSQHQAQNSRLQNSRLQKTTNSQQSVNSFENLTGSIGENATLGAQKISPHWRPDTATLGHLENLGVPAQFCQASIDEFILYWRERNEASHAWGSKFSQHVARRWQSEQQLIADRERRSAQQLQKQQQLQTSSTAIHQQWEPSIDAIEILERMGIHKNFVVDAIPEFVLYWQERGESQATWNSKFVAHTKRQWARFTNTLKHDTEPRQISEQWAPDEEVFEVLALANIEQDFAEKLIPEFVMYWRDRKELHHSWNTKFLQYIKYQWSRQHRTKNPTATNQSNHYENDRQSARPRKTRDRSLAEDLFDRSWAN